MIWNTIRVNYFNDSKVDLLLGPIREIISKYAEDEKIEKIYVMPHWKFGPHIKISIKCNKKEFEEEIQPVVSTMLLDWLEKNASTTQIDSDEYKALSEKISVFELVSGPYLPLKKNNTVSVEPYKHAEAALLEFSESQEAFLSDSISILLELLEKKNTNPDDYFLTLIGMGALVADSFETGMSEGYVSIRSHADYFFAAHDTQGKLKSIFDQLYEKRGDDLNSVIKSMDRKDFNNPIISTESNTLLKSWWQVIKDLSERNRHIVENNYDALISQKHQLEIAEKLKAENPSDFRDGFEKKKISDLGEAFLRSEAGANAQKNTAFLHYRANINMYYLILPILEETPVRKFLICHLLALSIENIFDVRWDDYLGT